MNWGWKLIFLMVASCSLAACSTTQITPKIGQNVVFSNGHPAVLSSGKFSLVGVEPIGRNKDGRLLFRVAVLNTGKTPFNFGLENVKACNAKGKPLRLYTREEIERHARVKAAWAAVAAGMSAAGQSMSASMPTQTAYNANSTYSVHNSYGRQMGAIYGNTSGTITTYNPAANAMAQQAIQANTAASMHGIQNQLSGELEAAQNILATTTVFPHSWYSGVIVARYSREANFRMSAVGDEHSADFDVR